MFFSVILLALSPSVYGVVVGQRDISGPQPIIHQQHIGNVNSTHCLSPDAVQTASTLTGQGEGTNGIYDGQTASKVDDANFINVCAGLPLTNGRQLSTSSCNGIPMGRLPAKANMVASLITAPAWNATLPAHTTFDIVIQTVHLRAGHLVNPLCNYYTAPQDLDEHGDIYGHCHITVQALPTGITGEAADALAHVPDPSSFVFFKGVDDPVTADGRLQTTVPGGLPAGSYRVCTMIAAQNHQPVLMPVAQRGAQDDCVRFRVTGGD
ncbi:hypothetical protein HMPREF1624_02323 [Sporothrix schenckii ATCC 58251]|uniref:Uncharacterized protein n=1 Tax=Sporothrix schenckii (strain ATCC 58251 / de Perez 2211183) TaxID=1391915 RepID=U7PZL3_SPOS1|nr:hypothetical protein HMPREF1624_02323 [Sporothrix schenckii ATCC 58251]